MLVPWAVCASLLVAAFVGPPAGGASWADAGGSVQGPPAPAQALLKLDRRLLEVMRSEPGSPVTAWVTFGDKGERDPDDLALALARAEAALTPRARARRERAGVWPRVDYLDLPVCDRYLESLETQGLRPIAISRWFNRAAVRVPARRLASVAALEFVERIVPVEKATRSTDWVEEIARPATAAAGGSLPEAGRDAASERGSEPEHLDQRLGGSDEGRTRSQLRQLNVPALHDSGDTGVGVLICILDADFSEHDRHEALRDKLIAPGRRRDFVDGDTTVTGETNPFVRGHGTWVMGCIAGNRPGTYMGSGFGADIALARTENGSSERRIEMLYWGMGAEWADSLGADIISSSLGYSTFDSAIGNYTYAEMNGHTTDVTRAAEIAATKGILVVNAVGNEGSAPWRYLIAPADVDGDSLIAVGAVDSLGSVAAFSSYGPSADGRIKPDLVARGGNAELVSVSGNPAAYTSGNGTSFAAPLVAGLAACLLQRHPLWTPQEVIRALRETASRAFRPDNRRGYGIPDALAASQWFPGKVVIPPPTGTLGIQLLGPNPVRPGGPPVQVRISMGDERRGATAARLRVVDAQGRRVRDLWSGTLEFGRWMTASWDGLDGDGKRVEPGVYFIALSGAGRASAVRVVAFD